LCLLALVIGHEHASGDLESAAFRSDSIDAQREACAARRSRCRILSKDAFEQDKPSLVASVMFAKERFD
jgi:hypothetical protein